MRRLEYERDAQADNQMRKHESQADQQRRLPQQYDRQNQHVGDVESFAREQDEIFPQRMLRAFQVIVRRKEKALEVPHETHSREKTRRTSTAHKYAGSDAEASGARMA